MSNDPLYYLKRFNAQYKHFKKIVEEREKERKESEDYNISLSNVVVALENLEENIRFWASLLTKVKKFHALCLNEYKHWKAKKIVEIRADLVTMQDGRTKTGLRVIPLRELDITAKLESMPKWKNFSDRIVKISCYIDKIDKQYYWPTVNRLKILESMTRFSVASERSY